MADGANIGSASDTDALAISSGGVVTFTQVPIFPNDTIETADIQDNAVTLAKMAGLARGNIIYGDTNGDPAALAAGGSGLVLKSDGTDISWGTVTASAIAADDITAGTSAVTISTNTGAINITPAANSAIVLDGTINVDAGVVTGATSITSTSFTGDLTGNCSGTAATVTGAAQTSITSVGTLTSLVVADGANIGSASDTDALAISSGGVVTFTQVPIFPNDTIETADIQDNAVTLAKMAGLARGNIIYGDTNGDPAALAAGGSGLVLKSDGTDISWGTVTASAIAADDITAGTSAVTISTNTGAINITPAANSAIVLDGTINVDAGVVTGATSITSTSFTGDLTGNCSGTAATVTGAAQTSITSVGTLTSLVVADGANIGSASDTDALAISSGGVVTFTQVPIFPNDTIETADIQDNAVTLAKMAGLARGNIIYGDTNGDPAALAIGGSGLVLKSDGTDISWGTVTASAIAADDIEAGDSPVTISTNTGAINITPAANSAIVLDGTINVDAGVVTGATSITSTSFTGDLTGNCSGTAATVTGAAQTSITSVGTLTSLVVADGANIGSASDTDALAISSGGVVTFTQVPIFPNDTIETADIQDNAVTLAKMAGLARGNIIYGDTNGDPAALAAGGSGLVLKSDGTDISWGTVTASAIAADDIEAGDSPVTISTNTGAINITPAANSAIVLDGTINVDAGVVTGATSITSTSFTGDLTGNCSGTAATVTGAAQTSITSVGTLTSLVVADGANIGSASDTDALAISSGGVVTFTQVPIFPNDTIETADIQDNAVTLAKMAGLARGNIIYGDTNGDPAALAAGGSGLVLKSDGTDISWGTVTASAIAADDITAGTSAVTISTNTGAINITPAANSAIVLDGTINVDAGVVTGATSITSTSFTGDLTGNCSGTAATVTGAAQTSITSVGTLTSLVVADGANIGSASDTDALAISSGGVVTFTQVPIFPNDTIETADIQDNAVTLAKMAGLSRGNIIYGDTNGDPAALAAGGSGLVLKSDGTDISWGTVTASAIAADDITAGTSAVTISTNTGAINITPAANSAIVLDGTINVDAGVVTGATSITSTSFTGDLTGNCSGTAATVTGAAQTSITSVGTLTSLVVADGANIGSASDTDALAISSGGVVTFTQVPIFPNDTIETADIQDNAVTLAKMAGLSRGNIIYGDTNGDPAALAAGGSGLVLKSDGTDISWGTVTASAIAADDITAGTSAVTISTNTGAINITPAANSAIVLDGTINVDAGVVTGATSITSTSFTGNLTGNCSGTATVATTVTVADNESTNENNLITFVAGEAGAGDVGLESDGDLTYNPSTGTLASTIFATGTTGDDVQISSGNISLKNSGTRSRIDFYCESSNAHYARLQAPAHSSFSGNVTLTLPATTDTLVGKTTTDTLTNKTLTSPKINEDVVVTATATELNIMDGDTSVGTTAVTGADGIVTNDGGTMKQTSVDTFDTYLSATTKTLTNKTLTSPSINSGTLSGTFTGNSGINLKNTTANPVVLTLQTGDTDIQSGDVIGKIDFQAPDETGSAATAVCAGIEAVSETAFAASDNKTKLSFKLGGTAAATEVMKLNSSGILTLNGSAGSLVIPNDGTIGSAGANAAITISEAGLIQIPQDNLKYGTTTVTATGAELNILSGVTATAAEINILDGNTSASSTTLVDADRVVVNNGGTMKQVAMTAISTYIGASRKRASASLTATQYFTSVSLGSTDLLQPANTIITDVFFIITKRTRVAGGTGTTGISLDFTTVTTPTSLFLLSSNSINNSITQNTPLNVYVANQGLIAAQGVRDVSGVTVPNPIATFYDLGGGSYGSLTFQRNDEANISTYTSSDRYWKTTLTADSSGNGQFIKDGSVISVYPPSGSSQGTGYSNNTTLSNISTAPNGNLLVDITTTTTGGAVTGIAPSSSTGAGGLYYSNNTKFVIQGGNGNAIGRVNSVDTTSGNEGKVLSIVVETGGSGYTNSTTGVNLISTGLTVDITTTGGAVTGVSVNQPGEGYTSGMAFYLSNTTHGSLASFTLNQVNEDQGEVLTVLEYMDVST